MKKLLSLLIVIISLFTAVFAEEVFLPDPKDANGCVYDELNILSEESLKYINGTNKDLENKTKGQIAIVLVKSLQGYDDQAYAVKIFDKWKIGGENDNGTLILLCIPEGRFFIMTGYETEGFIPDSITAQIRRNAAKYFPAGDRSGKNKKDYELGILEAYNEILDLYKKEYNLDIINSVEPDYSLKDEKSDFSPIPVLLQLIFIIFFVISMAKINRTRAYRARRRGRRYFYDRDDDDDDDDEFFGPFGGFFGGGFGSGSSGGGFGGFSGGGGSTGGGGSGGSW